MATKLERLGEELEKAQIKYDEWGRRVKDLEERYSEEENSVIHTMVHAANLTPEQLSQIIAMATQGNVGAYPEGMVSENEDYEEEDRYNDET